MPGVFDFLMNRNIFSIVCRIDETNSMKTNAKNMHISVTIRVDWVHLRHVYSWNTLNNLRAQEPRAVMCFSVLFDRGKFEMCVSFHSDDIAKSFFFQGEIFLSPCMSLPQWIAY